jgi:hypothetical protein
MLLNNIPAPAALLNLKETPKKNYSALDLKIDNMIKLRLASLPSPIQTLNGMSIAVSSQESEEDAEVRKSLVDFVDEILAKRLDPGRKREPLQTIWSDDGDSNAKNYQTIPKAVSLASITDEKPNSESAQEALTGVLHLGAAQTDESASVSAVQQSPLNISPEITLPENALQVEVETNENEIRMTVNLELPELDIRISPSNETGMYYIYLDEWMVQSNIR